MWHIKHYIINGHTNIWQKTLINYFPRSDIPVSLGNIIMVKRKSDKLSGRGMWAGKLKEVNRAIVKLTVDVLPWCGGFARTRMPAARHSSSLRRRGRAMLDQGGLGTRNQWRILTDFFWKNLYLSFISFSTQ